MDFSLTEDQKMLKAMLRDFAARELEPIAAQIDETAEYPAEAVKKIADLGLFGLTIPEEYGGSGKGNMGGVEAAPIPLHGRPYSMTFTLPPLATVFFRHAEAKP